MLCRASDKEEVIKIRRIRQLSPLRDVRLRWSSCQWRRYNFKLCCPVFSCIWKI